MGTKNGAAKTTGVKALARLRAEREGFEKRERELRREAAVELGEAVLKAADLALEPAQVSQLLSAAMRHGYEGAMALLEPQKPGHRPAVNGDFAGGTDVA